jgi:alkanesulfonate monooxygenase SsuD/methylene tetrahydromethanopterin reductase-like flavin-dependent oxidoreductase (luciferase family)
MAAAVDQLSLGRFSLGIVPGYLKEEFQTFRLPRAERNDMTNEFVRIMIALWTSDNVSFQGHYYSCDDIEIKPRCVQTPHVPLWIGGSSRNAMRRVAEFGDVWHPLAFQPVDDAYFAAHKEDFTDSMQTGGTTPALLRDGLEYIRELAASAGRDISSLQVVVNTGRLPDDPRSALGATRVVDHLGRYAEAGATGFSISLPGDSGPECVVNLARFADEIIPQL